MGIFGGKPNVKKMKAKRDVKGLIEAFKKYGEKDYTQSLVSKEAYISADSGVALEEIIDTCASIGDAETIRKVYQEIFPCKPKKGLRTIDGYAISTLGKMGDKRVVEQLIGIVRESADAEAISLLGKLKDKRAVEPLIKVLGEIPERGYYISPMAIVSAPSTVDHAQYVIHALAEIGDKRAVEPLKNVLKDSKRYAKSYVNSYRRLGAEFSENVVPKIEERIRYAVEEALKKIQR